MHFSSSHQCVHPTWYSLCILYGTHQCVHHTCISTWYRPHKDVTNSILPKCGKVHYFTKTPTVSSTHHALDYVVMHTPMSLQVYAIFTFWERVDHSGASKVIALYQQKKFIVQDTITQYVHGLIKLATWKILFTGPSCNSFHRHPPCALCIVHCALCIVHCAPSPFIAHIPYICHRRHRRHVCVKKIRSGLKLSRLNAKNCTFYSFWGNLLLFLGVFCSFRV